MASFPGHSFSIVLSIAVLSFGTSCSRRLTCALEGCTPNGSVVLATDLEGNEQASQDADAVAAEKSAVEKELNAIKERMELNESMTKLMNETLALHEKRIAALEDKSTAIDTAVSALKGRMAEAEGSITATGVRIDELEIIIKGDPEAEGVDGLLAELAMLQEQQADTQEGLDDLTVRVRCLEKFEAKQKAWNSSMSTEMSTLTGRVNDLFAQIGSVKESDVTTLKSSVDALNTWMVSAKLDIADLQGKATTLRTDVNKNTTDIRDLDLEIDTLRGDVDGKLATINTSIVDLGKSIALLQKEGCFIGEKERFLSLNYRTVKCDGVTVSKILVP